MMKTLIAICIVSFLFNANSCSVEERTVVRQEPPPWAPAYGRVNVYYYYFPDWEIYYYVPTARWVYYDGITWVYSPGLPVWCAHIDLYTSYKVTLNYKGKKPYAYHYFHTKKYPARHIYKEKRSPLYSGPKENKGKPGKEEPAYREHNKKEAPVKGNKGGGHGKRPK